MRLTRWRCHHRSEQADIALKQAVHFSGLMLSVGLCGRAPFRLLATSVSWVAAEPRNRVISPVRSGLPIAGEVPVAARLALHRPALQDARPGNLSRRRHRRQPAVYPAGVADPGETRVEGLSAGREHVGSQLGHRELTPQARVNVTAQ